MIRGQFIRLFIGTTTQPVVAAAKQLTLHATTQFENATTKDDTDSGWVVQEPVATSFDIQSNALVLSDDDSLATSVTGLSQMETFASVGGPLVFSINNVSGTNNRTKGTAICSGNCHCTSLQANFTQKQNADYTASFLGDGALTVGS